MADEHTEREAEVEQHDAPAQPPAPEVEPAAAAPEVEPAAAAAAVEPAAAAAAVEPAAAAEPPPASAEVAPAAAAAAVEPAAAAESPPAPAEVEPAAAAEAPPATAEAEPAAAEALPPVEPPAGAEPPAETDLASEPDYPPPNSVPRPPPPSSLKVYARPVVDEITPSHGPVLGEIKLTLVGANLFRASIVRIDGVIAQTIGADEPRELRVLTPAREKPGDVDVTIENPHAAPTVLAKAFHYEALAAPQIVSVAPDHVATNGRTELTVMGQSFVKGTVVLFDGKPVESARFVNATTIDVTVPPGENGKLVDVSVRNPDGATAVARRAFVYDERFG